MSPASSIAIELGDRNARREVVPSWQKLPARVLGPRVIAAGVSSRIVEVVAGQHGEGVARARDQPAECVLGAPVADRNVLRVHVNVDERLQPFAPYNWL